MLKELLSLKELEEPLADLVMNANLFKVELIVVYTLDVLKIPFLLSNYVKKCSGNRAIEHQDLGLEPWPENLRRTWLIIRVPL